MPDEPDVVWRIGHIADPLAFTPVELRSWDHRFDDERREFGSVYCAVDDVTAFREVLQELRTDAKARAEFVNLFGEDELPRAQVPWGWRSEKLLAPADLSVDVDEFADIADATGRAAVEAQHADVLIAHSVDHLDLAEATTRKREFTQGLARSLFDSGHAGVRFVSNLDGGVCFALFEGRAELLPAGRHEGPFPLTEDLPALLRVCKEWKLELGTEPDPA